MPDYRLREIFSHAKTLEEPERAEYLDRVCDETNRQRVEAMLAADLKRTESRLEGAADALTLLAADPLDTAGHDVISGQKEQQGFKEHSPKPEVDGFEIHDLLGQGGMGLVYRATQAEPVVREVAIKVIKPHLLSPTVLSRFARERTALAGLVHPNIATLLQAGQTRDDTPYFAMELAIGPPIDRYCDERNLQLVDRLRLFAEIGDAIEFAHSRGIVHRDLKPSNIVVVGSDAPQIKVIDFGIARLLDQDVASTRFTQLAQLVGTPLYMSPEQARGTGKLDARSDVYALGALLYKLVTGDVPLRPNSDFSSVEEIKEHIETAQPPKPSLNSDFRVSDDLDRIVAKALAKDPDLRYESAKEMSADVQRLLDGQPVLARGPTWAYRCRKFVTRHRRALAQGGVVLLLGIALGTLVVRAIEGGPSRAVTEDAVPPTSIQAAEDELKSLTEVAVLSNMLQDFNRHDYGALRTHVLPRERDGRLLGEPIENAGSEGPSLRRLLRSIARPVPQCTYDHPAPVYDVDLKKNTNLMAVACDDKFVWIWDVGTKQVVTKLGPHIGGVNSVAFSPDGKTLASGDREGAIRFWDSTSWKQIFDSGPRDEGGIESLAWSPNGKLVAGGVRYDHIVILRKDGAEVSRMSDSYKPRFEQLRFIDNELLLAPGNYGRINCWHTATGKLKSFTQVVDSVEPCRAFEIFDGREGLSVLSGTKNSIEFGWAKIGIHTGQTRIARRCPMSQALALSPDRQWCVSVHQQGEVQVLRCRPDEPPALASNIAISNSPLSIEDVTWLDDDTILIAAKTGAVLQYSLSQLLGYREWSVETSATVSMNSGALAWSLGDHNLLELWAKPDVGTGKELAHSSKPYFIDQTLKREGCNFHQASSHIAIETDQGLTICDFDEAVVRCVVSSDYLKSLLPTVGIERVAIEYLTWSDSGDQLLLLFNNNPGEKAQSCTIVVLESVDDWSSVRARGAYQVGRVHNPSFASGGERIAALWFNRLTEQSEFRVYDLRSSQWLETPRHPAKWLLAVSQRRNWALLREDTGTLLRQIGDSKVIASFPVLLNSPAYLTDNDRLILSESPSEGRADVWHIPTGKKLGTLALATEDYTDYLPYGPGLIVAIPRDGPERVRSFHGPERIRFYGGQRRSSE